MSYLSFHLFFLLPPIVLMGATLPRSLDKMGGWRARWALPFISIIALLYTTPWDNYLVAKEVWWYGPNRVIATIGFVPVEEYMFFVLQPILTGLFLFQYVARWNPSPQSSTSTSAWIGFSLFAILTLAGFALIAVEWSQGLYLGLVLGWASPLLAGMWLYDGKTLWAYRTPMLYTVGAPTLYLWIADATAISSGVWTISSAFTVGIAPLGLPLEEATFFLVTNVLVVNGTLLLLYGSHETIRESPALTTH